MSEQKGASLFITKLRERKDRNGNVYFIGSLGMATIMLRQHKTNADEWNMFLMEQKKKDEAGGGGRGGFNSGAARGGFQSGSGGAGYGDQQFNDDEIPF